MKYKCIKAILFDSGRVLNKPVSGHWFISPKFFEYVDEEIFTSIEKNKVSYAFQKANEYIGMQKIILNKECEYNHFVEFYNIFSQNLPELKLEYNNVELLAKDLVYNAEKYEFYDDALEILPSLKMDYKLAIVSDAWPSIVDVYEKNKLGGYFDCFVVSSFLGVSKPDSKMYQTALDELNVSSHEAIFVDDNFKNIEGAMALGINSILLCRDKQEYYWYKAQSLGKDYIVINDLRKIREVLKWRNK